MSKKTLDILWSAIEARIDFKRPKSDSIEDYTAAVLDYYATLDWDYGSPSASLTFNLNNSGYYIRYISGSGRTDICIYPCRYEVKRPTDILDYCMLANTLGFDFYKNEPKSEKLKCFSLLINAEFFRNSYGEYEQDIYDNLMNYQDKWGDFLCDVFPELNIYMEQFGL